MEERDREVGEHLRRAFEHGPVPIAFVGADLRFTGVNGAFCRLLGYTAEELATRTIADITHPDDVDTALTLAHKLFVGDAPGYSIDKRYIHKDGEVVWIELTVSVISGDDGRPVAGIGIVQDVSARHRELNDAQTELDRLARARDRILQFAGEGIYHVDGRGRITFANPAAARMLGWEPAELMGKPAHELLHHTRDDGRTYPREDCPIHGRAGTERAVETATDDRFWRRDGTGFPVHYRSTPVGEDGAGGTVVVFSDVSERKRMEAALRGASERAARERMQAAEAERARWARDLHDETLQGLAGLHVLLSSEIWPADAEGMRERIRVVQDQIENEMEKLRGLIAELRPAALDELGLAASVRDLAARTQTVYGIEVEADLDLDGQRLDPEVEVAAYRIVQESLGNAARHAGAGRVVIKLSRMGESLVVQVHDDGRGFDPASGTSGFGLRGMRERVDLLDGRLKIDSGTNGGTRVAAELPL